MKHIIFLCFFFALLIMHLSFHSECELVLTGHCTNPANYCHRFGTYHKILSYMIVRQRCDMGEQYKEGTVEILDLTLVVVAVTLLLNLFYFFYQRNEKSKIHKQVKLHDHISSAPSSGHPQNPPQELHISQNSPVIRQPKPESKLLITYNRDV